MSNITGCVGYKNTTAMQHEKFFDVFKEFITTVKPKQILEIGMAWGGITTALCDIRDDIQPDAFTIKSFDINRHDTFAALEERGVEIVIESVFNKCYTELVKPEMVVPYIQREGTTIVLCDGGNKVTEFNTLSPHIKPGDYILCHDYIDTVENFEENFKGKIWDWQEVKQSDIEQACQTYNLVDYSKESFSSIAWACKQKVS